MTPGEVLKLLDGQKGVSEAYVTVREISIYLEQLGPIKIRISRTNAGMFPYHYTTSHRIQTPIQAGPYSSSISAFETEAEAIRKAIDDLTSFIEAARKRGSRRMIPGWW